MIIYTPEQLKWPYPELEKHPWLIYPYVPAKSKVVLLHGPGGVGKSALLWSIANAIELGTPFLGIETQKSRTLVISTDMNVYELAMRWGDKFKRAFPIAVISPFDCTASGFENTGVYHQCKEFVEENHVEVVFIDTIGKIHSKDGLKEQTVSEVYTALARWFPQTTVVGNFHNRKALRDLGGNEIINEDDFRGSRKWVDDAVIQLHMRKMGNVDYHTQLMMPKNQLAPKADPIELYMDVDGKTELWSQSRSDKVAKQYDVEVKKLPLGTPAKDINLAFMVSQGVAIASAKRARAMYLIWKRKLGLEIS